MQLSAADGKRVLARAGQTATVTSSVEFRRVTGHNLIAARVNAAPQIVFGAHLDSVNGSPGANDNASGVLAVLATARRAATLPLAEQAWFVLFDAEEDGLYGSRAFARDPAYPIRETRAMFNLDMVGVAAEPLGLAGNAEVLALARQLRPGVRVFEDDPLPSRETFGRTRELGAAATMFHSCAGVSAASSFTGGWTTTTMPPATGRSIRRWCRTPPTSPCSWQSACWTLRGPHASPAASPGGIAATDRR
ncbi:M28 family metallopeptidase [Deinococcus radiopugnans]|uniref:M28 family metallopeptidase n=1 Tax=Deinococcus radiopugnans TaxID=57497 RepID=UPI00360DD8BB